MSERKAVCRAEGGVSKCRSPRCPERKKFLETLNSFKPMPSIPPRTPSTYVGAWTDKDIELFRTPSGSGLYGMNHGESDDDYYVVTPTVRTARLARQAHAKQSIIGNQDVVYMDFATFVEKAHEGVPQALEAMFSEKASSPFFEDYRKNFYASDPRTVSTYMRTIRHFSLSEKGNLKHRRHALRLSHNLNELLHRGRFNPTLSPDVVRRITETAVLSDEKYFAALKKDCPFDVYWEAKDRGRNWEKELVEERRAKMDKLWAKFEEERNTVNK